MTATELATFAGTERVLDRAHTLAREFLASLGDRPAGRIPSAAEMAAALDEPLPDGPADPAAVLEEWLRRAEPGIAASPGPRFFGFVTGGVTPAALGGDWLTSALDQNAAFWAGSPAAVQTELVVLRWLKELFDLPAAWSGALTSGATMANMVGLAAARQWAGERLGFDPANDGLAGHPVIPVVSSTEIHASALKVLGTLGLGRGAVQVVDAPGGRIDLDGLERELAAIAGPAIVVANAAEVNTGQFDDIAAIADRCAAHAGGTWLHVDGAFGLFAAASPRYRHLLTGVERADSVASDGHKWLNVPYDCGFAFVRDPAPLRAAFGASGSYITGADGWDPHTHVPEMSRRFRGLAAWCALKAFGREGYRAVVEQCVDNAAAFGAWVDSAPGIELLNGAPPLNIVCFRLAPDGFASVDLDDLNRRAVRALQTDGRAFVTGTVWRGKAAIRAAFDNWSTTPEDVVILEQAVADVAASITATGE